MGKTVNQPGSNIITKPVGRMSPAEAKRQLEAVQEFFAQKQAAWDALTPEEKEQADRDWELFKKSMNEGRPKGMEIYPD